MLKIIPFNISETKSKITNKMLVPIIYVWFLHNNKNQIMMLYFLATAKSSLIFTNLIPEAG